MDQTLTGAPMPDLALQAPDGGTGTLHGLRGGRGAVVYFHRSAGCPVCASHARALVAMRDAGELGDRALVLVVPGGPDEAAVVARRHPGAPAVRASGTAHAEVGLGTFLALQHSGVFLVEADGTVAYRRGAAVPLRSFDEAELRAALRVADGRA